MRLNAFGISDIGLNRSNNEDVLASLPEIGFFVLADGMGGHQAGEVAAREAVNFLCDQMRSLQGREGISLRQALHHAIEQANRRVYEMSRQSEALSGMGTTLCCVVWTSAMVIYAHIGDSRIYRLKNRKLELLTKDHSFFAKWLETGKLAETCETPYPYKHVITRALGTTTKPKPEIAIAEHEMGDLYFLCTDGLSDVLTLVEMEAIINRSHTIEEACKNLIERAKIRGSSDNITLLMVRSEPLYTERDSRIGFGLM
ncbi:MAG: serine/threonine-protein phosphatase [Chlamydiia bacterium]|nr:serine/threonine-protein phosphatase [Chlamydiia bacterium]